MRFRSLAALAFLALAAGCASREVPVSAEKPDTTEMVAAKHAVADAYARLHRKELESAEAPKLVAAIDATGWPEARTARAKAAVERWAKIDAAVTDAFRGHVESIGDDVSAVLSGKPSKGTAQSENRFAGSLDDLNDALRELDAALSELLDVKGRSPAP
jgi:hypothetical protein